MKPQFFLFICLLVITSCYNEFREVPSDIILCPGSLSFDYLVGENDTIFFTSEINYSGANSDLTYTWSFGDGPNSTSNEINPFYVYPDQDVYTVNLTVTTIDCPAESFTNDSVTVGVPRPKASFEPMNSQIRVGESLNFQSTTTGVVDEYRWFVNENESGTGDTFNPTFNEVETASVWLEACGHGGCDTAVGQVIVRPITFAHGNDFDNGGIVPEKIYGVVEFGGGGYGMLVSNNTAIYLVNTDEEDNMAMVKQGPFFLGSAYPLEPSNFVQTGNEYLFVGTTSIPSDDSDIFVFRINAGFESDGFDSLQEPAPAGNNKQELGFGAAIAPDGSNYLICGNILNTSHQGIYLATVSNTPDLNVEDRKYLFSPDSKVEARFLVRNPTNTGYWVAGTLKNPTSDYEAAFFRINNSLNVVSQVYLGEEWTAQKLFIFPNEEDCLVIGNKNNVAWAAVVRSDNSFEVWSFPDNAFNDAVWDQDGRLAMAGSAGNQAALFRLNTDTGNLETMPIPTQPGSLQEAAQVLINTQDKGFALGGYYFSNTVYNSLFIKTDQNGVVD